MPSLSLMSSSGQQRGDDIPPRSFVPQRTANCQQEIRPSQTGAVMKEIKSEKRQKVTEGAVLEGAIREQKPE